MPKLSGAAWSKTRLKLHNHSLVEYRNIGEGMILKKYDSKINTSDLKVESEIFELSYGGIKGMSGGPLCDSSGRVIGLMSFGLPVDKEIKTRLYAITNNELLTIIKNYKKSGHNY